MSGDLVGRQVGDFQMLRRLGRGGMAEVYAARQLSLKREVAIKVLLENLCRDEAYVKRFRREALAAAKLNHPNIVMILDVGQLPPLMPQASPRPYIVQELIDGENLRETITRVGALPTEDVYEVMMAVAMALDESSAAGIIHRDIKPENILRSTAGVIKIADFGLARLTVNEQSGQMDLTGDGVAMGTPRYMSPEQIQGHPVDVRSDLYSLGVTAYHLATGQPPFDASDAVALAVKHLHQTHEPILKARQSAGHQAPLDLDLIDVIDRLLAKSPEQRYQSPAELIEALGGGSVSRSSISHRNGLTKRLNELAETRRTYRRLRKRAIAAGLALAIGLAALTFGLIIYNGGTDTLARLRPSAVPRQETVEDQFLVAISRNDIAGWNAVESYFEGSDQPGVQQRVIESRLQLARVLGEQNRRREQRRILEEVIDNGDASRLHRVMSLSMLEGLVENAEQRNSVRRQCATELTELTQLSPEDAAIAYRLIPEDLRLKMDLAPPR